MELRRPIRRLVKSEVASLRRIAKRKISSRIECEWCSRPFLRLRQIQRFCGEGCRRRAENHRRRDKIAEYERNRYRSDVCYNLKKRVASGARHRTKGGYPANGLWRHLPYTPHDLERRLRATIPPGYTWEDFLSGELHVDHIVPASLFDVREVGDAEFHQCWAIENLQLLPAIENIRKSDRVLMPLWQAA